MNRTQACQLFHRLMRGTVLAAGYAAATILPSKTGQNPSKELRIDFDGDAVLFSDESERIFKQDGLAAFTANETASASEPMSGGPFKNFLAALHRIQNEYPSEAVTHPHGAGDGALGSCA